jgi:Zn-dependent metalloprotease
MVVDHFCTIFGSLVKQYDRNQSYTEKADWLIGEGMFTRKINAKALRSMSDPGSAYNDSLIGKDSQVSHMRDYKKIDFNNGGVHIFSGIPNRAFYLTAAEIGGYAWEKTGKIWYMALREILKDKATFKSMAKITCSVAGSLFWERRQGIKDRQKWLGGSGNKGLVAKKYTQTD